MFSDLVSLIQGYLRTIYLGGLSVFTRALKMEDMLLRDYSTGSQGGKNTLKHSNTFKQTYAESNYEVQIIEQKASVEVV